MSQITDPYLNIATEEYLLKHTDDNIFYLYLNSKSLIIGKHQNTLSEVNYPFILKNNIPVIRRLSGGGTVFHDEDNINFCFIMNGEKGKLVDFKKYIDPVIDFLKSLHIHAEHGGRNDILIEGCKISGNASHVFKNRVMHHGTLLFNSQLDSLTQTLKNDPLKYTDKAVKSVRSKVVNIYNKLENKKSTQEFTTKLYEYITTNYSCSPYILNEHDYNTISKLKDDKYNTWEWNYGYSPAYELKKRYKTKSGKRFEIKLKVTKGEIKDLRIKSNATNTDIINKFTDDIMNKNHNFTTLKTAIEKHFKDWNEEEKTNFLYSFF